MAFLDGLSSLPQLGSWSSDALQNLTDDASNYLQDLVSLASEESAYMPSYDPAKFVQFGPFALPRGLANPSPQPFNLQAPTTRSNAMRVVRACQVSKPVLLEGSPGVGKTSLVMALANITGHHLCRINLSDQTDLVDLFGSDLPVEGGRPGEFAWKDAEFLRALQEGHWVLLDEMNLAPQAVLEGLNSVLDHRGTVYIPELGRSFTRHPSFRIFAAQNPLHQGGGRKGLPKSFLNRFTKVYLRELSPEDILIVCLHLFPDHPVDILRGMIMFNTRLHEEVTIKRTFGREGAPWEFNLRDILRWASLLKMETRIQHPAEYLDAVYLARFRNSVDRAHAARLFEGVFSVPVDPATKPHFSLSATHAQVGRAWIRRSNTAALAHPGRILHSHLRFLEAAFLSVLRGWLVILTGPQSCGKKSALTTLAHLAGNTLRLVSVSNATDTTDILGSFEQSNPQSQSTDIAQRAIAFVDAIARRASGTRLKLTDDYLAVKIALARNDPGLAHSDLRKCVSRLLSGLNGLDETLARDRDALVCEAEGLLASSKGLGRFEWIDGPLICALKEGHWLLLDGANLCSPSVLDRLNSLCESNGTLVLSERGHVDGRVQVIKPHPNFRLFMSVDPRHGELSRAMRNRGVEVALFPIEGAEDFDRLADYYCLPGISHSQKGWHTDLAHFEACRRGLVDQTSSVDPRPPSLPAGHLINADAASLAVGEFAKSILEKSPEPNETPLLHFMARVVSPAYEAYFTRWMTKRSVILRAAWVCLTKVIKSGVTERQRAHRNEIWEVPSTLLLAQVSTDSFHPLPHNMLRIDFHVLNDLIY